MPGTEQDLPRPLQLGTEDIERVRRTFNFDPADTEGRAVFEAQGQLFDALSEDQRRSYWDSLGERRECWATSHIRSLFDDWKESIDDNGRSAYLLEKIAKAALDSNSEIRYSDKFEDQAPDPLVSTYKDLFRISQAYLSSRFENTFQIFRGIRSTSVAMLTAQALDNPSSERYYIKTSVLSNHSSFQSIGERYSEGIVISWDVHRNDIALALDGIYETAHPEDEMHARGGVLTLGPERILHTGHYSGDVRPLSSTINCIGSPSEMTADHHFDFMELVTKMSKKNIGVRTDEGAERLASWFHYFQNAAKLPAPDLDILQDAVDVVKNIDRGKEWNH